MIRIYDGIVDRDTHITMSDKTHIVEENNEMLGLFNTTPYDNKVIVDYELLPELRGKHLATHLLDIIEDYIIDTSEVEEILLLIKSDNEKSIKIATKNGYAIDHIFLEENIDELNSSKPYVKKLIKK